MIVFCITITYYRFIIMFILTGVNIKFLLNFNSRLLIIALLIIPFRNTHGKVEGTIKQDINYLEDMHAKNPNAIEFIIELADRYKKTKQLDKAIAWFKRGAEIQPDNIDIVYEIGILLSWSGRYGEAIAYFKRILQAVPNHFDAQLSLARVLSWQGKRSEALALCDEVLAKDPQYIDAYEIKARIHTWNSNFTEAADMYEKILEIDPSNNHAQTGLINIIAAQGNYNKAIARYEEILENNPYNALVLRELGKVISWQGDFERAISLLKQSLEINPDDDQTIKSLTRVYRWAGRYTEGIKMQKEIFNRDETNVRAILEIALLYDMQGSYKKAIKWYEKASALDKDNPQIDARLGLLYSRADRIDDSVKSLQRALNVLDNDVNSLITLGKVYSWKKRVADSISLYRRALQIDPNNQEAYIGLGRVFFYDDKWEKAATQFRKALEINPLNREAAQELEKIKSLTIPHFTTRYDYFKFKDYDHDLSDYNEIISYYEVLQTIDWAYSPTLAFGAQYKRTVEQQISTGGIRDYRIVGNEYALYTAKEFYTWFNFSGKLISNTFRDDENQLFSFADSGVTKLYTGYGLLQYERDRWMVTASYAREPFPTIQSNVLKIGDVKDAGTSLRYELTDDLSLLGFYFNKMFHDKRHRKEHGSSINYYLPFHRQCELGYQYSLISDPSETQHEFKLGYRDVMFTVNYYFAYSVVRNTYVSSNLHKIESLYYLALTDNFRVNFNSIYEKTQAGDKDVRYQAKFYLTYYF